MTKQAKLNRLNSRLKKLHDEITRRQMMQATIRRQIQQIERDAYV